MTWPECLENPSAEEWQNTFYYQLKRWKTGPCWPHDGHKTQLATTGCTPTDRNTRLELPQKGRSFYNQCIGGGFIVHPGDTIPLGAAGPLRGLFMRSQLMEVITTAVIPLHNPNYTPKHLPSTGTFQSLRPGSCCSNIYVGWILNFSSVTRGPSFHDTRVGWERDSQLMDYDNPLDIFSYIYMYILHTHNSHTDIYIYIYMYV